MFKGRQLFTSVRYRVLLLAFVPLLSILSSFTPFFTNNVSAVTAADVLNRARAWSILQAVIDNASRIDSSIAGADVDKCHIFGSSDNNTVFVGHHVTGNNDGVGAISANGASWDALEDRVDLANAALASVGINGGCRGLLEKMGFTNSGGNMNQPRDFRDKDSDLMLRLSNAIAPNDPFFFGVRLEAGAPSPAISYAMLIYDLKNVCGWEYRNPFVENDTADTDAGRRNREAQGNGWSGDSKNSHFRTYTYESNKAGWNTYYKGAGREDDVFVGSKTGFAPSGNNDATLDCGDNNGDTFGAKLADNHGWADAYAYLLRPGTEFTPGTCGEKYPAAGTPDQIVRANNIRAACDEGFKNKTAGYCDKFNADQGLKDACLYGQRTATGGSNDTTPPAADDPQKAENKTSCVLPGIGWIVCPVLNLMAELTNGAYAFVAALLTVQPILTTGNTKGIYDSWLVMRNFANVAFVIAFLIIIFSQVTSAGIGNYGIKKLLPRLIVAAILVNLSYWICSIAVDLSNIAGSSLKGLFDGIGASLQLPQAGADSTGEGWVGIVGGLLAGTLLTGAALYIGLSALIPVLLGALVTIAIVFIALVMRQALIILLIVVSPMAFVAYLLPNTENMFNRWRGLFWTLLLMYPVISLIFGASALASKIVMGSA